MSVELEKSTSELISQLTTILQETKDSVIQNYPDFANQILVNGMNQAIFNIILCGMLIIILIFSTLILFKISKNWSEESKNTIRAYFMVVCITFNSIVCCILLPNAAREIIKIKSAPKVYVADKIINTYISKLK